MRRFLVLLGCALGLIVLMIYHPEAQTMGSGKLVNEQDAAPAASSTSWLRNLDKQEFVYSDSLGKWVGQPFTVWGTWNGTNIAGPLKLTNGCIYDSTTATAVGWYMPETCQLMRAYWNASNTGAGINNVQTDIMCRGTMDTTWALGAWTDDWVVTPSGAIADSGAVVTIYLTALGHPSSVNPDHPCVWLEFRPVVTP